MIEVEDLIDVDKDCPNCGKEEHTDIKQSTLTNCIKLSLDNIPFYIKIQQNSNTKTGIAGLQF